MNNQMIYKQMSLIMGDIGFIRKNRTNSQQGSGYKFRGIDDIYAAAQPVLVKHGVFCAPSVLEHNREERISKSGGTLTYTIMKVEHKFYADDGSFVSVTTIGEAMDSGDKSSNKAMSAAIKYAFIEVFCIPTEGDNDTENQTHEIAPRARPQANTFRPGPTNGFPKGPARPGGPVVTKPSVPYQDELPDFGNTENPADVPRRK